MALNPRFVQADREVIWIVGASTGIGQALAERLAGQGASVVVSARNAVPLESFQATYPAGMAVPLDVTDAAAVRAACETGEIEKTRYESYLRLYEKVSQINVWELK